MSLDFEIELDDPVAYQQYLRECHRKAVEAYELKAAAARIWVEENMSEQDCWDYCYALQERLRETARTAPGWEGYSAAQIALSLDKAVADPAEAKEWCLVMASSDGGIKRWKK